MPDQKEVTQNPMERFEGLAKEMLTDLKSIPDAISLKGKVAMVTGGGAGLGYAVVNRMCEAGAKAVILDFDEKLSNQAVDDFTELGYDVTFVKADVRNVDEIYAAVDIAVQKYGKIDILVNSAGFQSMSTFLDMPEELYDRCLDVNLKGSYFVTQAVARHMVKNKVQGKVINIASNSAVETNIPVGMHTHYGASKGGLVTLTIGMARELWQYGIQVNAVAPGGMRTYGGTGSGMKAMETYPDLRSKISFDPPAPISNNPDEVALMVYIMATDVSNFIVGETIYVDGGARYALVRESLSKCLE